MCENTRYQPKALVWEAGRAAVAAEGAVGSGHAACQTSRQTRGENREKDIKMKGMFARECDQECGAGYVVAP